MKKRILLLACGIAALAFTACQKDKTEESPIDPKDTTAPSGLVVSVGTYDQTSIQLKMKATDESGSAITYTVTQAGQTKTATGASNVEVVVPFTDLTADTEYTFSVVAADAAGNKSAAVSKVQKTLAKGEEPPVPTEGICSGGSAEKFDGFEPVAGYKYSFATTAEGKVEVMFELLDADRTVELGQIIVRLGNTPAQDAIKNGNKITATLTGSYTKDTELTIAGKFVCMGGPMLMTKDFIYKVGSGCTKDEAAPTAVTATTSVVESNSVVLLLNGQDDSGVLMYEIKYGTPSKTLLIGATSGTQKSVTINTLTAGTAYTFEVTAVDYSGNKATSVSTSATTTAEDLTPKVYTKVGKSGAFQVGYKYTYTTTGSSVKVEFESLESNSVNVASHIMFGTTLLQAADGVVVSGKTISYTFLNQTMGDALPIYAVFVLDGLVGQNGITQMDNDYRVGAVLAADAEAPTNFTATLGEVTSAAVELKLKATDNSGLLVYTVEYTKAGSPVVATYSGVTNVEKQVIIGGLTASTSYVFTVTAKDLNGNAVPAQTVNATTAAAAAYGPGECGGSRTDFFEGNLQGNGYSYKFTTSGSTVLVEFESDGVLTGVVGYVFVNLAEKPAAVNGKKLTYTITGVSDGQVVNIGAKFAYAGGMGRTKTISYTVGNNPTCELATQQP